MIVEKRKKFIINAIYFTLIIAIVYFVLKYVLGLFMPFIIGFIVALILEPGINFVSKKWHLHKKTVAFVLILLFYGAVGFLLSWVGVRLFNALQNGIVRLPELYARNIEPAIYKLFGDVQGVIEKLDPQMVQALEDMAASLSRSLGSVVSNITSDVIVFLSTTMSFVPGLFLGIIFAVISSVFIALDYSVIIEHVKKWLPVNNKNILTEIKDFITGIGFKYVKAYLILMSVTFMELALGLSILQVDKAVMIAALIALIDILPVFGTGGVVIPWIIIELIMGNIPFAIGLTVLYLIITVIRNVLEPKLVGHQIGLHPLAMLIGMYVGVKVFGFIGLFALPIAIVIVKHLYESGKIHFFGEVSEVGESNE